jgi:hypothetical protein
MDPFCNSYTDTDLALLNYVTEGPRRRPEVGRGGGGEREPIEILSIETGLCPTFKTPNKTPEGKS